MERMNANEMPENKRKWIEEQIIGECEKCGSTFIKLDCINLYGGGLWEYLSGTSLDYRGKGALDIHYRCERCRKRSVYNTNVEHMMDAYDRERKRRRKIKETLLDEISEL